MKHPESIALMVRRGALAWLTAGVLVIAAAWPAVAQEAADPREQIRLPLTVEGWVATETAEVVLSAHLTLVDQDPAKVREEVMKALAGIEDAEWRIVSFSRDADSAGAERWRILASARVPQGHLDGLHERVRVESRKGRTFRVARVDTTPSLAEREAVLRGLRGQIYVMAKNELVIAKVLWPDRDVRIAQVQFGNAGTPLPAPEHARREMMTQSSAGAGDTPTTTEQKIVLRAWVTLVPAE